MDHIKIGCKARDLLSGYEGLVSSKSELMNGNVQFAIKTPQTDGVWVDGMSFDAVQLEYVDSGISHLTKEPEATTIQLGQEVEDIVSGFVGIATVKTTFLNGCVYFDVAAKTTKDLETKAMFIPNIRLKVVGDGVLKVIKPAEKPTGGPATRAMRPT